MSDMKTLLDLNNDYINSIQSSDVVRFDEILAQDFRCSNPDGTLVGRADFLVQTEKPVSITDLQADQVEIRIMGDFAIIHARTSYIDAEGTSRSGRYTDVWARQAGDWLAVSAHVTRG